MNDTVGRGPFQYPYRDEWVWGHQAWLERFRLDFTEARSRGWKFTADTTLMALPWLAAIVVEPSAPRPPGC